MTVVASSAAMRELRMTDTSPVRKLDSAASARVMPTSSIWRMVPRKPPCQFSFFSSVYALPFSTGTYGPVPSAKLPLSALPLR